MSESEEIFGKEGKEMMQDPVLENYMKFTAEGSVYPGANTGNLDELGYLGLGLAGETGESVDVIKKLIRLGVPLEDMPELRTKLIGELGDVFWYYARLLAVLDVSLYEVIQINTGKLQRRQEHNTVKLRNGEEDGSV